MADLQLKQIAYIITDFDEKFGIPRQSGRNPELIGKVVLLPEYQNKDALRGIEGFTHLWLIFDFNKSHIEGWSPTVRPPRLGGNKRMGVFATRSPFRPNPIGLSSVKLLRIEEDKSLGLTLVVSGADLLNGTPIYDIKPYLPSADSHPDATGGFAEEFYDYKLNVDFPVNLLALIPEDKRKALINCLADDPRPSYQNDPNRVYKMSFAGIDVHFTVNENNLTVTNIKK